jgi:hypothetical protein
MQLATFTARITEPSKHTPQSYDDHLKIVPIVVVDFTYYMNVLCQYCMPQMIEKYGVKVKISNYQTPVIF